MRACSVSSVRRLKSTAVGGRDGIALGLQILQQGADAGVGVLHIVHRVLAVLPDGQTQIELHLASPAWR